MALLQTCRQIKGEALPFFFSRMIFNLRLCSLGGFVDALGEENVARVTSIIVMWSDVLRNYTYDDERGMRTVYNLVSLKRVRVLDEFWPSEEEEMEWNRVVGEFFGRDCRSVGAVGLGLL
jgi:hypothetical protein